MIANTDYCPAAKAELAAEGNTCVTHTIPNPLAPWTGYKMLNAELSEATGFVITDTSNISYTFGKITGISVVKLPTYGIVGNICGMKFDNFERMQYFAFKYD